MVLAVVAEAVIRIGKRVLKNGTMITLAAFAFVGIFFLETPFPVIVLGAGLVGFFGGWLRPDTFVVIRPKEPATHDRALVDAILESEPSRLEPSIARALRVLAVCLLL